MMFDGVVSIVRKKKSQKVLSAAERAREKERKIGRWDREWFMKSY